MEPPPHAEVSTLHQAWSDGDKSALDKLVPIVYDELRRLARHYLRIERPATAYKRLAWSTKLIFAWWITSACAGIIERTSSLFPHNSCGEFWLTMHGVAT